MNRFNVRYYLLLLSILFVTCSDEDTTFDVHDTPEEPAQIYRPLLTYNTLQTTETMDSDAQPVTRKELFTCNDGLLIKHQIEQTYTAVEPIIMTHATDITYQNKQIVITDSYNNITTYQLNEEGYAESCTRKEGANDIRLYHFDYTIIDNQTYLSLIEEFLSTDESNTPYSYISIDYQESDTLNITQLVNGFELSFTASINKDRIMENLAAIPCPTIAELHPLSMHTTALYGQIIGNTYPLLIQQIEPENNEKSQEKTTYQYVHNETGVLTDCYIKTISYGKTYNRKISYQID